MSLFEYYIRYLTEVCEGSLKVDGFKSEKTDEMERAMELQQKIAEVGIPEFVRRCAAADGTEIPQEAYDEFDPEALMQAMQQAAAAAKAAAAEETPSEEAPAVESPAEEEPTEKQNAYEAFLDCLCLEDALLEYLIDVLKNDDGLGFFRLSQVTVRRELKLADFLYWFATKELYADADERACVTIIDTLLDRLAAEGQMEAVAALIAGDQTTFELIRCDAPELRQLPAATYEWFCEYYLSRYYPIRAIMKIRGVKFPEFFLESKNDEA